MCAPSWSPRCASTTLLHALPPPHLRSSFASLPLFKHANDSEIEERQQIAAALAAIRDDQMRLCAADVQERIDRGKREERERKELFRLDHEGTGRAG